MSSYKMTTEVDMNTGEIRNHMDAIDIPYAGNSQRLFTQIIQTQDAQVREALIALGWTPPDAMLEA